jgi:hypothetical protein
VPPPSPRALFRDGAFRRASDGKRLASRGGLFIEEANMKALACTLGAILAVVSWSAPTRALDITFDDVASVGNPSVTVLDTHGYRFTGSFRIIDVPGGTFVDDGSPVYIGHGADGPGIGLARIDGAPFDLYEFGAAGLFLTPEPGSPNARQVSVSGVYAGGGSVSASYDLGGVGGFVHFTVPSTWSNLELVMLSGLVSAGTPGALALDDIGVGQGPGSSVAEPGTLVLALTTALGLGAMLLTRRRRTEPVFRRR